MGLRLRCLPRLRPAAARLGGLPRRGARMTPSADRRTEGFLFLLAFGLSIPAANWLIGNVGTVCVPNGGPCLIPVAPGLLAPPALVLASAAAFLLGEAADLAVYTPLQKRGLVLAVAASSVAGLVLDS